MEVEEVFYYKLGREEERRGRGEEKSRLLGEDREEKGRGEGWIGVGKGKVLEEREERS